MNYSVVIVWVTVSSTMGPEKGTNNGILTGLTGLADRTRFHVERLRKSYN
jgi:hypothetical protein